jgi:hypothetical protein
LWVTNDVMERTTVVTTQTKKTVVCFILCAFIYFRWYQIFVDKQIVRCSLTKLLFIIGPPPKFYKCSFNKVILGITVILFEFVHN